MFVDARAIVSTMAGEDTADAYEAALLNASAFTSTLAAWGPIADQKLSRILLS